MEVFAYPGLALTPVSFGLGWKIAGAVTLICVGVAILRMVPRRRNR